MRVFKYLSRRFAKSTVVHGRFRIGTATSFRPADGHEDGRADPDELFRRWTPAQPRRFLGNAGARELNEKLGLGLDLTKDWSNLDGNFAAGSGVMIDQNAYLLCCTAERTPESDALMLEKFEYDACIEIADVYSFAEILTAQDERLRRTLMQNETGQGYVAVGPVEYRDIDEHGRSPDGDSFTKREKFSWQNEVRIMWNGHEGMAPFFINSSALKGLLTRVL